MTLLLTLLSERNASYILSYAVKQNYTDDYANQGINYKKPGQFTDFTVALE